MKKTIYYWNPTKQDSATLEQLRLANPNASIPDEGDVSVFGYFPLQEPEVPEYDQVTQDLVWIVETKPSVNGPTYFRKYTVVELPSEVKDAYILEFIENQKKAFIATVQKRLDLFAQEKGYDDIKSAIGYLQSSITQFKTEAEVCLQKRDEMWFSLFSVLEKVQNGTIPLPKDFADIEQYLPVLKWK